MAKKPAAKPPQFEGADESDLAQAMVGQASAPPNVGTPARKPFSPRVPVKRKVTSVPRKPSTKIKKVGG